MCKVSHLEPCNWGEAAVAVMSSQHGIWDAVQHYTAFVGQQAAKATLHFSLPLQQCSDNGTVEDYQTSATSGNAKLATTGLGTPFLVSIMY
jgi:hypothetical protein